MGNVCCLGNWLRIIGESCTDSILGKMRYINAQMITVAEEAPSICALMCAVDQELSHCKSLHLSVTFTKGKFKKKTAKSITMIALEDEIIHEYPTRRKMLTFENGR